jgi:asparagine synthetase B (glutamine-hydrolysing)
MAWGLEARVPFLDKKFLEVAMNVDAEHKMFSKGADQEFDEDGRPKMEKVGFLLTCCPNLLTNSTLSEKLSTAHRMESLTSPILFSGVKKNNSQTVWDTPGSTV